jgi:DNA-binding transcriptional MerR regulator
MEYDEERTYSIGELANEVGVSTRTVRYYVSEGLLPPPEGGGPGSRYTDAHRARLEAINDLKEQYLPLKEIRRRLAGFELDHTHAQVRPTDSHSLAKVHSAPPARALAEPEAAPYQTGIARSFRRMSSAVPEAELLVPAMAPPTLEGETDQDAPGESVSTRSWRRIRIGDEAELLITDESYRRNQGKIDWLMTWAKRVLDS